MRQLQNDIPDEKLRKLDLKGAELAILQQFDVTEQVMERISLKQSQLESPKPSFKPRVKPSLALSPVMILALVFGLALTGAAASQFLEFRDDTGKTTLITAKPTKETMQQQTYTQKLAFYEKQVQQELQPGEYAAYYVKDSYMNERDGDQPIKFVYQQKELSSYADFVQEAQRKKAPALGAAEALPEDYAFDYGYVYPSESNPLDAQYDLLQDLKKELSSAASAAPEDETLFIKKLNWTKADFSLAQFSKGRNVVTVTVREVSPASTLTLFQQDQDAAEKLSIAGTDAFFIKSTDSSLAKENSRKNWLGWKDAHKNLLYEIYDTGGSSLTKQDLVTFAKDFLLAP